MNVAAHNNPEHDLVDFILILLFWKCGVKEIAPKQNLMFSKNMYEKTGITFSSFDLIVLEPVMVKICL